MCRNNQENEYTWGYFNLIEGNSWMTKYYKFIYKYLKQSYRILNTMNKQINKEKANFLNHKLTELIVEGKEWSNYEKQNNKRYSCCITILLNLNAKNSFLLTNKPQINSQNLSKQTQWSLKSEMVTCKKILFLLWSHVPTEIVRNE